MEIVTIAILLIVLFAIWIVSTQRKLAAMDENINNAMSQIGVQLSSLFDALLSLLDLAKSFSAEESLILISAVSAQQRAITAESTPEDVISQVRVISDILAQIITMAEHCPDLKADKNYVRYLDAVDCYKGMVHTSCLIYNDSVAKFNQSLRHIPTRLVSRIFGFCRWGYLETSIHG